jgi:hypothetical protein
MTVGQPHPNSRAESQREPQQSGEHHVYFLMQQHPRSRSTETLRIARAVVAGTLLSGAVGTIGLGVVLAPAASARPVGHLATT